MNPTGAVGQAAGSVSGGSEGNSQLKEAFDYAIKEAQMTLSITTKKGADLYALKQRPQ